MQPMGCEINFFYFSHLTTCQKKMLAIMYRMPKIHLRPSSPEFFNPSKKETTSRICDMPGCNKEAEHKAPKDRDLKDYYFFCMEHVQEYNRAWNYFQGMSNIEMEEYFKNQTIWDRPTMRYDPHAATEELLKKKIWQEYHFTEKEPPKEERSEQKERRIINGQGPELEALAIMELEPPIDLPAIKARYKELAKKHHPDRNQGSKKSEELLKKINMAYTILKVAYEKYDQLPSEKK